MGFPAPRATATMRRMATPLNREFDSRVLTVSIGPAGVTRPRIGRTGELERVYCLHCGKPGGAVTAQIPAFLRGDPGVIYVCGECDAKFGKLPAHAISFERRRES